MKRFIPHLLFLIFSAGLTTFFILHGAITGVDYADALDLLLAAQGGGLAHPPGYPLLIGLYRLINWLIGGNRITLAGVATSAVSMGIVAATGVYITWEMLGRKDVWNWLLGLGLVTWWLAARSLWVFGMVPEVMPFSLLLLSLTGLMTIRAQRTGYGLTSIFGLMALMTALVLNHSLVIGLAIPLWLWLLVKARRRTLIAGTGLGLITGIVFTGVWYALSIRPNTYGWPTPVSWLDWFNFISRRTYDLNISAVDMYRADWRLEYVINSITYWWGWMAGQVNWGFILIAFWGIKSLWPQRFRFFLLMIPVVFYGVFVPAYMKSPTLYPGSEIGIWYGLALRERMFYPMLAVLLICAGLGIKAFLQQYNTKKVLIGLSMAIFGIGAWRINHAAAMIRLGGGNTSSVYASQVMNNFPPNAVVLVNNDEMFNFLYVQQVQGIRPDIMIVPTAVMITPLWYGPNEYRYDAHPPDINSFVRDVVSWNLYQGRRVFAYQFDSAMLETVGIEGNPFYGVPFGYSIEIMSDLPQEIAEFDYGLSVQLAAIKVENADPWFKAFRASIGYAHAQLAYLGSRTGHEEWAAFHLRMAKELSYMPVTSTNVIRAVATGRQRFLSDGSYWRYAKQSAAEWAEAAEIAKDRGDQNKARFDYERAIMLEPENESFRFALDSIQGTAK